MSEHAPEHEPIAARPAGRAGTARSLLEALERGPLVLDGPMGTRLIAQGLQLGTDDPALWNLTRPEIVRLTHDGDIAAGADALLTNTFGANRATLEALNSTALLRPILSAAVKLARAAAGPSRFVIGCMGPRAFEPGEGCREEATLLLDAGVDALLLETLPDANACAQALTRLHRLTDWPVLVSAVDGESLAGEAGRRLVDLGAAVLGANCTLGMEPMLRMAERFEREGPRVPLLVKPSAEAPGASAASPASFASAVPALVARGVRLLGSCCGGTEAHVAALRGAVDACAVAPRPVAEATAGARMAGGFRYDGGPNHA